MLAKVERKKPDPIDVAVGHQIRQRRKMLGMSQQVLAEKVGITFQQIQKYEKGTNRVGSSRLQNIATAMQVTAAFFFQGIEMDGAPMDMGAFALTNEQMDFMASTGGTALNLAFMKIRDPQVRRDLVRMIESIAAAEAQTP